MSFDDSVKERIRESIDIVELVSQYIPLRRYGQIYKGLCPWHHDSKPSFEVNPIRQSYMCWPCHEGGDVFAFVMKMENVGFREAMEILAEKAGVTIPKAKKKKITIQVDQPEDAAQDGGEPVERIEKEVSKQTLLKAAEWLAGVYHEALWETGEAAEARKYLEDRKIDEESIRKFQLGYAPSEPEWLVRKVKGNRDRIRILELIGNLQSRYEGWADPFRGRVIFPIRDSMGRTIAFGGRVFPGSPLYKEKRFRDTDEKPAKYYNSKESPLFAKHRNMYALDLARHTMKTTRRALIMEGYTDVIAAHRFGFGDAVAALGTALGADHIRMLSRYVDKMVLLLDGDEAGRKRADQVLELFVAQGVDMSVLTLPEGQDPAEFLEQHGAEAFRAVLETETVPALEHAFRSATKNVDLEHDIIASSRALDSILGIIAQAPGKGLTPDDPIRIRIDKTIQNLSHRFLVTEQQIRQRLKEKRQRIDSKPQYVSEDQEDSYEVEEPVSELWSNPEFRPDALEREMLELWLADPTTVYEFWEPVPVERCRSPITRMIYEKCDELVKRNKPATFENLIVAFDDPKMKSFLVELDESGRKKREAAMAEYDGPELPPDVYHDEMSDLQESLRSETEELQPLPGELRERLVREILDGFDRRDETRDRLKTVSELRGDSLTEEEKTAKLLQQLETIRKQQEEKRRRMEN